MRTIGLMLLLLLLSVPFCLNGQLRTPFENKALLKALKKEGVEDMAAIEGIPLEDSAIHNTGLNGYFYQVRKDKEQTSQYLYVGRVNTCRTGGCAGLISTPVIAISEYFDYFILFDDEKNVQRVGIFNYQATHGHEITARGWLRQFIGYDGSQALLVDKNIDAISGATISVYAITEDVGLKTDILKSLP